MFAGELPWLVTSLAVTIPGTYFILKSGPKGAIIEHPMPGDHYHGEGDEGHGEDEEGETEGNEGNEGDEEASEDDSSSTETDSVTTSEKSEAGSDTSVEDSGEQQEEGAAANADSEDAAAADSSSTSTQTTGKRLPEQPTDNAMKKKNIHGEDGLPLDQRHELEKGPQGQTRLHTPDPKGGAKKRVESAKGIAQGRGEDQEGGGSIGDVKDGSKSAAAGQTPAQQKGLSNTDTKHSTDLMKDPEKSKTSEGVPETAKIQGTVQPGRKPS
ncbi:MAG: hypothetical protein M1831_000795 [Alyxoria varia]|nr:MAG: hypothetical protein M1831_000795 [Alyxoria varia]